LAVIYENIHKISFMKRKIKIILTILILLLGLKFYSSSEMHFPLNPYIDTIFAKGFSWEKFKKVEIGMSQEEVKTMLGEPLKITDYEGSIPGYVCWKYSTDGKLWPYADLSFYLVQICLTDGAVVSKPVTEFNN